MILDNIATPIQTSGGIQTAQFAIACNGKAFRVLSDTLYQNKIGSIVRELACNAYDAHVMADKKEEPIVIHLPDNFEPWFSVQDCGVGLSPDAIKNVFTVYFESTKDKSNESLGAFGLGAKTPFSYTDQFTVTSVYAGTKSIYGMYITESGIPDYSLMHSEETSEENGVEIKISIKKEDFYKVRAEVEKQLAYFSVKPKIVNGSVNFTEYNTYITTDNFILYKSNWNKSLIIQGQVAYPLDLSYLPVGAERNFVSKMAHTGIALIFNIGEIGVIPSREGVEYTKQTVDNIIEKIKVVQQEFNKFAQDQLKACKNDWERAIAIRENKLLSAGIDANTVKHSIRYGGDFAFELTKLPSLAAFGSIPVNGLRIRWHSSLSNKVVVPWSVECVVIKDSSFKCEMKLRYLRSQSTKEIIVVTPEEGTDIAVFTKNLQQYLGGFTGIKLMSDLALPAVDKAASIRQSTPKASFYIRNRNDWIKSTSNLSDAFDKEVVYAVVERKEESGADYQAIVAIQAIEPTKTIIGITKQVQEKIKDNLLFVPVLAHYSKLKANSQSDTVLRKMLVKATIGQYFTYSENIQHFEYVLKKTTDTSDFKRITTMVSEFKRYYQTQGRSLLDAYTTLGINPNVPKKIKRMQKLVNHLKNKYPLLDKLKHNLHDQELAKYVARYVELEYNAQLQSKQPNQTI